MARQQIENMRGEVEFRRKLYEQQVGGEEIFQDEYDSASIEAVLRDRITDTVRRMEELRARGIALSPYVEVGAERGQRSLAMENHLGCEGAAVDLSLDLLKSCEHYRQRFGLAKSPLRVCADAHRLPFATGSVPFVFCYQTLHHFPDPSPIVAEIHRVLAPGGCFFFAEEPYRQVLHVDLYAVNGGLAATRDRGLLRRIADRFLAHEVVNEEEYGVVENHDIPLREWRRLVSGFESAELSVRSTRMTVDLDRGNPLKRAVAYLMGGQISGVCRKAGKLDPARLGSLASTLISPAALAAGAEVPLAAAGGEFASTRPGDAYPVVDGVAMLIEPGTRHQLYPELSAV